MQIQIQTAVLMNGCPGGQTLVPKKGLRRGDLMSPYLFLLVADVLQAMIKNEVGIRHPIAS